MNDKPLNLLLLVLIVGVLTTLSWLLGQRHGAQKAMSVAATRLSSVEAQAMIDELQAAVQAKRLELEAAENLAQTNAARAQALADQLQVQMRKGMIDANDLMLYRQIENSEKARSIDIATLAWEKETPSVLDLTLVQWQGRDRVSGEVEVALEYHQVTNTGSVQVDLEPLDFDFRFFQKLAVNLPERAGDDDAESDQMDIPEAITVRIAPADDRLQPVTRKFLWNEIGE